ncbi:MAG: hypothetical protein OXR73_02900 [Myxococcales bacterium]|nr:hypothetical protein [Myxococcales bacterium]
MMARALTIGLASPLVFALAACGAPTAPSGPQIGSQTNWLLACRSANDCNGLRCLCGVCSDLCQDSAECGDFDGASCIQADDEGAVAVCAGIAPPAGMCLPRCTAGCPLGTDCIAGVCAPLGSPAETPLAASVEAAQGAQSSTPNVLVDASVRHQTLAGFGAAIVYTEGAIVAHPDREALYDLLFKDSGLDAFRLGNRYEPGAAERIRRTGQIVAAASERIGRPPLLFMTSPSPPAALKANGRRRCAGELETCTLASSPDARFDYTAFARYWRQALDAYANAGVTPAYVSIQNNPNWVPPADNPLDGCRFLPAEGTATVTIDDRTVEVAYPGYREALTAVRAAVADLQTPPRFVAPEASGLRSVGDYVTALGGASFDAIAVHLYDMDAAAVDIAALSSAQALATTTDRPIFQTEMRASGLETAILAHHAVTAGGASAYLQNDLIATTRGGAPVSLVHLTGEGFAPQGPYYALQHYAKHTDPGWVRVDAASTGTDVLASAWLSPDERALTVVLVNPETEAMQVELMLTDALPQRLARSEITRTVFASSEHGAHKGALAEDAIVELPAGSIVTVAFTAD